MISFENDYSEGACEEILNKLFATNLEQTSGYGEDSYSEEAKRLIRKHCNQEELEIFFMVGGTQTNATVISSILRPYQGVVSADCGHINTHESGAIEATGHKVISLPSKEGKITAQQISDCYQDHYNDSNHEHVVQPGMVYISNPTEYGTLYSKQELETISGVCHRFGLPLFLDGARLGYGLAAEGYDVTLPDIAALCDVFYIGGTKQGALFGEAVVFAKEELAKDFRYCMKQRGGLMAKGRLLGIQFQTLFESDLYLRLAHHANRLADRVKQALIEKGYPLLMDSITNQQFPIVSNDKLAELSKKYKFITWEKVDEEHTAIRICTSWATKEENVDSFISDL